MWVILTNVLKLSFPRLRTISRGRSRVDRSDLSWSGCTSWRVSASQGLLSVWCPGKCDKSPLRIPAHRKKNVHHFGFCLLPETSAESSLQAKQLQLKRARLADDLNDKISHRPGPMELIHKNILPVHSSIKQAIISKPGQVWPFTLPQGVLLTSGIHPKQFNVSVIIFLFLGPMPFSIGLKWTFLAITSD